MGAPALPCADASRARLDRDPGRRDRLRPRLRGGGREAVPDPVGLDGADAPLRAAARGCTAQFSDRVVALRIVYRFRAPRRGDIVVFHAPAAAATACGQGGTFVKRIVGVPGEVVSEDVGKVAIDGKPLSEPYVHRGRRDVRSGRWRVPNG